MVAIGLLVSGKSFFFFLYEVFLVPCAECDALSCSKGWDFATAVWAGDVWVCSFCPIAQRLGFCFSWARYKAARDAELGDGRYCSGICMLIT